MVDCDVLIITWTSPIVSLRISPATSYIDRKYSICLDHEKNRIYPKKNQDVKKNNQTCPEVRSLQTRISLAPRLPSVGKLEKPFYLELFNSINKCISYINLAIV